MTLLPNHLHEQLADIAAPILSKCNQKPTVGIVLGSGLSGFGDSLTDAQVFPYSELPHFPDSTVAGHSGKLIIAPYKGTTIACLQGRFHYYEGYDNAQVTLPVRLLKQLGVETLILTNAAGGIQDGMSADDLMLITDHLNMMGRNPLTGKNLDFLGPRFPDMTNVYSQKLQQAALSVAKQQGITLKQGVYAGVTGPSYETPAEIRMLKTLGADAVGMSTVPEAIAARHAGIDVLGLSCISNLAAGLHHTTLTHEEVLEAGKSVAKTLQTLVGGVLDAITTPQQPKTFA